MHITACVEPHRRLARAKISGWPPARSTSSAVMCGALRVPPAADWRHLQVYLYRNPPRHQIRRCDSDTVVSLVHPGSSSRGSFLIPTGARICLIYPALIPRHDLRGPSGAVRSVRRAQLKQGPCEAGLAATKRGRQSPTQRRVLMTSLPLFVR